MNADALLAAIRDAPDDDGHASDDDRLSDGDAEPASEEWAEPSSGDRPTGT